MQALSRTETIDWHQVMIDAVIALRDDKDKDPVDMAPEAGLYLMVIDFFNAVSAGVLAAVKEPYINEGPNGEIGVTWILPQGRLTLEFYRNSVNGYLTTGSCSGKKAGGIDGAIELVNCLSHIAETSACQSSP